MRRAAAFLALVGAAAGFRRPLGLRMASTATGPRAPHEANVANANFYVDKRCIDCDVCRWMAPAAFGRTSPTVGGAGQSYVYAEPQTPEEKTAALRAMSACPTASIHTRKPEAAARDAAGSFPLVVDAARLPRVFHLGYHSEASFGATSYFVATKDAGGDPFNIMFDSPRYVPALAKNLEAAGGVQLMVVSHKDDVAEMNKWKARFPDMQRVMHAADVRGEDRWPYIDMTGVEQQLTGDGPWELAPGVKVVHTPGHSAGSITLILSGSVTGGDGVAFTGDHLALSARLGRLDGFAAYGDDHKLQVGKS
uniref:Metallo-beta-lactamase domain-containing protein n=3 Tax=Phaeomonas parva TaxID=124430 RepID=A0A7S1TXG1_9STRA|mmetsp:Transcript_22458/g.69570  ORF Transcript_22458/g.69570 Transcript_22458/m.69570 type:complete len:308 (+) Transcript_22458:209-1132(+)